MTPIILLLRHFESKKNIEDRHGGIGSGLTPVGVQQGLRLATYIQGNYPVANSSLAFYGHNVIQVKESVEILSNSFHIIPFWDERLRGINLGYLAGLSREEAARDYPDAAHRLELWRQDKLRADELLLPGGEDFISFENRIRSLLNSWLHSNIDIIIAVCSRSTLIMLANLVQLGSEFNYASYKVLDFASASITEILVETNGDICFGKINYTLG